MTAELDTLQRFLAEVIAEPGANLTAAVLLLAALAVVLLMAIVVIGFFLIPDTSRRQQRPAPRPQPVDPEDRRTRNRNLWIIAAVILVVALLSGYWVSSRDQYCASCHGEIAAEWSGGSATTPRAGEGTASMEPTGVVTPATEVSDGVVYHGEVDCVSCHEDPLLLGAPGNLMTRTRHVLGMVGGVQPDALPLPSYRCLECHGDIMERTIETTDTRVSVSHKEPLDAGMVCTECHAGFGHESEELLVSQMSMCTRCHDGVQVSSECSLCHQDDVAYAAGGRIQFSPVSLPPPTDCNGCHSNDTCDSCHGIRMPHSTEFVGGEHARDAGFYKKQECWACHTWQQCGKCHQVKDPARGFWGHGIGDVWLSQHGKSGFGGGAGCGCHGRSPYARSGNYCAACH